MNVERERTAVVEEALSWLRTPYHALARIKGVGVDCAQLVIAVYTTALGIEEPAIGTYAIDWFLHSPEEKYLEGLAPYAMERKSAELTGEPGDIALFRFGRAISHAGIVVEWPLMVHADRHTGRVTLDSLADGQPYRARLAGVYSLLRWVTA
jgi:cell wall-associated NlpC family hydrolase